ncbi:M20/M25/M40 family metallo-hydrolase [Actinoplanes sp. NPDC051633]|uniref:M20/M25/M40 family metallo-hydrolase n=1 Tax=Actinoplanes sp. NPDC051633 TaxID=3155670 RepID=UPI003436FF55
MSPMRDAPDRALARPRPRLLAALVTVLALAAAGVAAGWSIRPPAARDAGAPPGEFSAGRAFQQVEAMASVPHPAGSAANDRVREQIIGVLRGLGLDPQVQDTVTEEGTRLSAGAGGIGMARVRNVVATIPGTAPTGRVFLVAHYDSVQTGPGANDDGAGVSTILEAVRALTTGPRLRNDVVVVLTDAEEACLCGAQAFVQQHPLARDGGVVLNFEARGSRGPVITFETSPDDNELIGVLAGAPKPVGTSFAVEVYRLLPNDTDFTAFRNAGFRGLNAAYIDGAANYHAPTDTPGEMDRDSLQQHGDNALALTRAFGGRDLNDLEARSDATYFPVPGMLAHYPSFLVWPIAVVALLAVCWLGAAARRRGYVTRKRLIGGFVLAVVPIALTPVLAQVLWLVITRIRPEYVVLPIDPYRPLWFRLAVVALSALILVVWYAILRRRLSPTALAVGGLGWLAVLGLVLAWFAPGGSYLAALPALAGAVFGRLAIALRGGWGSVLAIALGGAASMIVLLPLVVMFFPALGMQLAGAGALLVTLLGLALLPAIDLLHPEAGGQRAMAALRARRLGLLPTLLALAAVIGCTANGLRVDRFDEAHPVPTNLMYALDANTGQARWLSGESEPGEWTSQFVSGGEAPVTAAFPAFGADEFHSGPAAAIDFPAPLLTRISDTRGRADRILRLRLRPQRPVRFVALHVAADAGVTAASAGGRSIPVDREAGDGWGFGFVFHAPPAEGVEVILRVGNQGRIRYRAMDVSDGVSFVPGFRIRPADVGVMGSHSSDQLAIARTYDF